MDTTPNDTLHRILTHKRQEVVQRRTQLPLRDLVRQAGYLAPRPRGFAQALVTQVETGRAAVIAEIKKASPSKGLLRDPFDPVMIATDYATHGATCLSVLTDTTFFQGALKDLVAARAACNLPVLRKDFIVDPYQIYEARAHGADCILLIVAALSDADLLAYAQLAEELGLDVLVEVHDEAELERALALPVRLIGINNRNLRTFHTDIAITVRLLAHIPDDRLIISESGIHSRADVQFLRSHGVHAFLIGEEFMRAPSPGERLTELLAP